jgi:hypothetical protein
MDAREAAAEEQRRKWKLVHEVLNLETEELVRGALQVIGMEENSAEWNAALSAWRAYQREQRELSQRPQRRPRSS